MHKECTDNASTSQVKSSTLSITINQFVQKIILIRGQLCKISYSTIERVVKNLACDIIQHPRMFIAWFKTPFSDHVRLMIFCQISAPFRIF